MNEIKRPKRFGKPNVDYDSDMAEEIVNKIIIYVSQTEATGHGILCLGREELWAIYVDEGKDPRIDENFKIYGKKVVWIDKDSCCEFV